jgi:hypothetical protein
MILDPLGGLAADLDLARQQRAARLLDVSPPGALLADLHGIGGAVGDRVQDTVTGSPAEVLGFGVENVQVEE